MVRAQQFSLWMVVLGFALSGCAATLSLQKVGEGLGRSSGQEEQDDPELSKSAKNFAHQPTAAAKPFSKPSTSSPFNSSRRTTGKLTGDGPEHDPLDELKSTFQAVTDDPLHSASPNAASPTVLKTGEPRRWSPDEPELASNLPRLPSKGATSQQLKQILSDSENELPELYQHQMRALQKHLDEQAARPPAPSATPPTSATTEATRDKPRPTEPSAPVAALRVKETGEATPIPAPATKSEPTPQPKSSSDVQLTAAQVPEAAPAATTKPEPLAKPWREQLDQTIAALREAKSSEHDPALQKKLETTLRLLQLSAGRHQEAVTPIESLDASQRDFWKELLYGLHELLDEDGNPVADRRSTLALRHLRQAMTHITSQSTLDVHGLAFCSQVQSYGRYTEFKPYEFKADQEVLLYVEVDNFTPVKTGEGFETELKGSYEIRNSRGERVADQNLPLDKQTCRVCRRDYFIAYRMYLPKQIESGTYTLQLTVEDVKGKKFGQSSLEFRVK